MQVSRWAGKVRYCREDESEVGTGVQMGGAVR